MSIDWLLWKNSTEKDNLIFIFPEIFIFNVLINTLIFGLVLL